MRKVTGKKKEANNEQEDSLEMSASENGELNKADDAAADPLADVDGEKNAGDDASESNNKDSQESSKENGGNDDGDSDDEPLSAAKAKKPNKKGKAASNSKKASSKKTAVASKNKKKVSINVPEDDDDENEGDEEYEVSDIVDHKYVGKKLHYLIRWKGYTAADDTWEPKDSLSCPEIIKKYEDANDVSAKGNSKVGGKRKAGKAASKAPPKKAKKAPESEEDDENGEKEYEVARIIEVRNKKNGKREFLVRWKGYSASQDTWEPEENLSCDDLISAFDTKLSKAKSATQKELRVAPKSTKRYLPTHVTKSSGIRHSKRGSGKEKVNYADYDD